MRQVHATPFWMPDDHALDIDQLACKAAGAARVRQSSLVGIVIGSLGISAVAVFLLGRRQSVDKSRPEPTLTMAK